MGGRVPTLKERQAFFEAFRRAVKGGPAKGDRSARPLQQLLILGHGSDLLYLGAQKLLKAIGRWADHARAGGRPPTQHRVCRTRYARAFQKCLDHWGWTPVPGQWAAQGRQVLDLQASYKDREKAFHDLRSAWRCTRLEEWLKSPRRDAIGRSESAPRLGLWTGFVSWLLCFGHAVSCMCGGMSTDAKWTPRGPQRLTCECCGLAVVPSVDHVFWVCCAFAELRAQVPRPVSMLAARVGWSPNPEGGEVERLMMMGRIRHDEVKSRKKRFSWTKAWCACLP